MWFENLFGFPESRLLSQSHRVHDLLTIRTDDGTGFQSLLCGDTTSMNDRSFPIGRFSTPTLEIIRNQAYHEIESIQRRTLRVQVLTTPNLYGIVFYL